MRRETIHRVTEIELGGLRLLRDRGLVRVCDEKAGAWQAVIYEVGSLAADGLDGHLPLSFAALDHDGAKLHGWASAVEHDAQTASLYVEGSGVLEVRPSAARPQRPLGRGLDRLRRARLLPLGRLRRSRPR